MILARWPRWKGLLLVFVAQLAFGVLVAPVVVAPVFIEESFVAPDEALREYGEYLWSVVTFEWIGRGDSDWILAAVCLAWTLLAVAFISPIVGPARREPAGRALWPSVIAAATLGAFIVAMLFAAIVEGAVALVSADQSTFSDAYDSMDHGSGWRRSSCGASAARDGRFSCGELVGRATQARWTGCSGWCSRARRLSWCLDSRSTSWCGRNTAAIAGWRHS